MWDDLVRRLHQYPTAVLTIIDPFGYPYSVRCVPTPDPTRRVLEMTLPAYLHARPGPAGLLFHWHDDFLWKQTNFVAYGHLEPDGGSWVFRVSRLIEGAGAGNRLLPQLRFRASANRYLKRRALSWPQVPWEGLHDIYRRARRMTG